MTILDTLAARFGYRKAAPPVPQMLLAMADAERWSLPSMALSENQAELYARLSWVAIAVQFIADAASAQGFNVKRRTGEDLKDVPNHEAEQLLSKPNPLMSRSEFLFGTFAYRALTGNAYWYINAPRGDTAAPAEVWLVPSHKIQPIPDGRSYLAGYQYDPGSGQTMTIPVEQVVHFRRFHPLNSFVGLSPIEALATTAQADMAMQRWNANFFGKDNAKVPGILAYRDMVNDSDWQRIQEDIKRQWGGTNRSGPMTMRGAGDAVSWIATSITQKDMEFLSGRQASKEEILQMFGVPPGLVDRNATEANAQAAKAVFAEYTLWPLLVSIAETITLRLLPRYGGDLVGMFDDPRKTDRIVDLQEQTEYARTHTIDEIRAEYYEGTPIGDDRGLMLPAEIGIETLLKLENGKIPEPQPVPEALAPFAGQDNAAEEPIPDEEPGEVEGTEPADDAEAEMMKADLARWQAKSRKRGKVAAFDSAHIPAAVKAAVQVAGFDWVSRWDALKAKQEPDRALEERLRKRIAAIFGANGKQWLSAIVDKRAPQIEAAMDELRAELATVLTRASVEEAIAQAVTARIDFDIARINAAAMEWAHKYTFELVKGIDATTRRLLSNATRQFMETPGMTVGQLTEILAPAFGDARAGMIAITETTRAFSQGTTVYQEMLKEAGVEMRRIWNASGDERVCDICGPLNGKGEEVWEEYDGPPAHVNCVLPDQIVAVPGLSGAAKSLYRGRVIEIRTANGRDLAVTENHPILTRRGWVAAQFIHEGDEVVAHGAPERVAFSIYPHYDHRPTRIEQVFASFQMVTGMTTSTMPLSPIDLHGDGRSVDGDIEIVRPNSELLRYVKTSIAQPISEMVFDRSGMGHSTGGTQGTPMLFGSIGMSTRYSNVGSIGKRGTFFRSHTLHPEYVGGTAAAALNPMFFEDTGYHTASDGVVMSELQFRHATEIGGHNGCFGQGDTSIDVRAGVIPSRDTRFLKSQEDGTPPYTDALRRFLKGQAALIEFDRVTRIRERFVSIHVYDLQAELASVYTVNGIIASNCRCWTTLEYVKR